MAQIEFNPKTHKVVPIDAVVLEMEAFSIWRSPGEMHEYARGLDRHGNLAVASLLDRIADQIEEQVRPTGPLTEDEIATLRKILRGE